jgi:hypothetical protein
VPNVEHSGAFLERSYRHQGQGSAHACSALIEQHAHGKSAHARDLDRLAQKLDQRGGALLRALFR